MKGSFHCPRIVHCSPVDYKAEDDFVQEIGQIIDDVQTVGVDAAAQVLDKVTQRIDRPTNRHD